MYYNNSRASEDDRTKSAQKLVELEKQFRASISDCMKDQDTTNEEEPSTDDSGVPLRVGSWTIAEERYARRIIKDFKAGILCNVQDGYSLKLLLSQWLRCTPQRIYRKFKKENSIGPVRLSDY